MASFSLLRLLSCFLSPFQLFFFFSSNCFHTPQAPPFVLLKTTLEPQNSRTICYCLQSHSPWCLCLEMNGVCTAGFNKFFLSPGEGLLSFLLFTFPSSLGSATIRSKCVPRTVPVSLQIQFSTLAFPDKCQYKLSPKRLGKA